MSSISYFLRCVLAPQPISWAWPCLLLGLLLAVPQPSSGQDWSAPPTAVAGAPALQPLTSPQGSSWPEPQPLPPRADSAPLGGSRLAARDLQWVDPYQDPAVEQAGVSVPDPTWESGPATGSASAGASLGALQSAWGQITDNWQEQWSEGGWTSKLGNFSSDVDVGRMIGSLALVLGGYFAFLWLMGRLQPRARRGVPTQVLEVLGSIPFGPGRNLQIIRLGSKLLLLVQSNDGTQPIGEITDPAEVEYLASLCPGRQPASPQRAEQIRQAVERRSAAAPLSSPAPARHQESHLSSILQSLNGPRGNHGAVFEA